MKKAFFLGILCFACALFWGAMQKSSTAAGPDLDPDSELPGRGFAQRRSADLTPEHPLVLEYLKQNQDSASPDRWLLSSQDYRPGDDPAELEGSTFNNALVAMAFILKGEKQRAERILDFYANAVDTANTDITLQNFYCDGQARGFYQYIYLRDSREGKAYHRMEKRKPDRWMGDMVWLLYAYKHYEQRYQSDKYQKVSRLMLDLIKSYYEPVSAESGYIQSGWRKNDAYIHETAEKGHPEGNIDCYALFMLYGETDLASKIYNWLNARLANNENLPLDLYSWRVQAFGKELAGANRRLLDMPEYDLRYRKILTVRGKTVMGFYHGPEDKDNFWMDGIGHMAVAYYAAGDTERGNFYANQYDHLLIDVEIDGVKTKAIPYVLDNTDPNYTWVDITKGFTSVCAWYVFAKNRFNPMRLAQH